MLEAIKENDINKLEQILRIASPNCVNDTLMRSNLYQKFRYTPLSEACREGDFEMVQLLVKNGADVNYVPINTIASPLCAAVESDSVDNLKIVKFLIENGADVNYFRKNQLNPISAAVINRERRPNGMEILEVMLEAEIDSGKKTALESACYCDDWELIKYLVEEWGYDASDPACIGSYCYGGGEYSYEKFEYFLEKGANPYEKYHINDFVGEKSAIDCLEEKSSEWAETLVRLAEKYGFKGTKQDRRARRVNIDKESLYVEIGKITLNNPTTGRT